MRLPAIVERNKWTLAHERFNADWIVEQQVGMVVSSLSHLGEAVAELLSPANYERSRTNAAALQNSAVLRDSRVAGGGARRGAKPTPDRQRRTRRGPPPSTAARRASRCATISAGTT